MTRIFKFYSFEFSEATRYESFSSYPGFLYSGDDYYLLSSGLVVIETTLSVYDTSIYKYLTPSSLFTWMRTLLSNRLSKTAKEWCLNFKNYNSGTYKFETFF